MLATRFETLAGATPAGVAEVFALVDGFDDALVEGLGRLDAVRGDALDALAGAVATTPMGPTVRDAAETILAGSVTDDALVALAGARTAVLGAAHDALLVAFDAALGRARSAWGPAGEPGPAPLPPGWGPALAGCRSWLRELAIAGWRGVDEDLVSSSAQARQAALVEPGLRRLAVLLDGMAAELRASGPVGLMSSPPVRRWGDLWARAQLLAWRGDWPPAGPVGGEPAGAVSGRLLVLGAEVAEHDTAARLRVHAILEPAADGGTDGRPRLVRAGVTVAKVDTLVGPALWRLLEGYPVLLGALAGHRALEIADMALLGSGDLVWREDAARLGDAADPFVTARVRLAEAVAAASGPLDRHPVRIAEPVLLEGYTTTWDEAARTLTFDLAGASVVVEADPVVDPASSLGPLTPALLASSSACLGLLRWDDDQWWLRPLAAQAIVKKKPVTAHAGDWALGGTDPKIAKARAKNGDAVAVLRERAGRLLRR
ncbi:hypothetical protein [Pseudofrankia asymbiotica]|uniref:Uncharacterized protein n=1 Tax=Pseudofrankia asymbiotica TaxID=1834516 RepID=A0A1V2I2B5_9ACTN|nr:hypothetical protein [Pseudofrankia asymbiotica]ONH24284.1 hypothetical protein BL253_30750 [Pseudofrankia asymbiotica]